jgi:hypothetical protein
MDCERSRAQARPGEPGIGGGWPSGGAVVKAEVALSFCLVCADTGSAGLARPAPAPHTSGFGVRGGQAQLSELVDSPETWTAVYASVIPLGDRTEN